MTTTPLTSDGGPTPIERSTAVRLIGESCNQTTSADSFVAEVVASNTQSQVVELGGAEEVGESEEESQPSSVAGTSRPSKPAIATDEQLLEYYCQTRDRDAFEALVSRYERELYNYLRRYVGNPALAEDAFQGTFLQLHLKCDQFDPSARLRPWLYTIATHQAIDALRKARRHQMVSLDRTNGSDEDLAVGSLREMLAAGEDGPVEHIQSAERRDWVREAVSRLPTHLEAVVRLAYYQGLKYREVAEVLGLPVGTVKSRLHAAIQKLHEAWRQSGLANEE